MRGRPPAPWETVGAVSVLWVTSRSAAPSEEDGGVGRQSVSGPCGGRWCLWRSACCCRRRRAPVTAARGTPRRPSAAMTRVWSRPGTAPAAPCVPCRREVPVMSGGGRVRRDSSAAAAGCVQVSLRPDGALLRPASRAATFAGARRRLGRRTSGRLPPQPAE